jgi:hypothetical protein
MTNDAVESRVDRIDPALDDVGVVDAYCLVLEDTRLQLLQRQNMTK